MQRAQQKVPLDWFSSGCISTLFCFAQLEQKFKSKRRDYVQILLESQSESIDRTKDTLSDVNFVERKLTIEVLFTI